MPRTASRAIIESGYGGIHGLDEAMKQRCREMLERAYLFLDGEGLSNEERIEIEAHLEECGPCFERYGLEGEVRSLVARLRGVDTCPEALKSRITSLLQSL